MKRVLIWNFQNRMLGRLSAKTSHHLKQIAEGKNGPTTMTPGSHLVREWNGRIYQVELVDEPPAEIDRTLVQMIVKGHRWLAMVVDGNSFSEIEDSENVSKRRV